MGKLFVALLLLMSSVTAEEGQSSLQQAPPAGSSKPSIVAPGQSSSADASSPITTDSAAATSMENNLVTLLLNYLEEAVGVWSDTQGRIYVDALVRLEDRERDNAQLPAAQQAFWAAYKEKLSAMIDNFADEYVEAIKGQLEAAMPGVSYGIFDSVRARMKAETPRVTKEGLATAQTFHTKLTAFLAQMRDALRSTCGEDAECAVSLAGYPLAMLGLWFPRLADPVLRRLVHRKERAVKDIVKRLRRISARQHQIEELQHAIDLITAAAGAQGSAVEALQREVERRRAQAQRADDGLLAKQHELGSLRQWIRTNPSLISIAPSPLPDVTTFPKKDTKSDLPEQIKKIFRRNQRDQNKEIPLAIVEDKENNVNSAETKESKETLLNIWESVKKTVSGDSSSEEVLEENPNSGIVPPKEASSLWEKITPNTKDEERIVPGPVEAQAKEEEKQSLPIKAQVSDSVEIEVKESNKLSVPAEAVVPTPLGAEKLASNIPVKLPEEDPNSEPVRDKENNEMEGSITFGISQDNETTEDKQPSLFEADSNEQKALSESTMNEQSLTSSVSNGSFSTGFVSNIPAISSGSNSHQDTSLSNVDSNTSASSSKTGIVGESSSKSNNQASDQASEAGAGAAESPNIRTPENKAGDVAEAKPAMLARIINKLKLEREGLLAMRRSDRPIASA